MQFNLKSLTLSSLALLLMHPQTSAAAPVVPPQTAFTIAAYDDYFGFGPRVSISSKKLGNVCWPEGGNYLQFTTYNKANCGAVTWSGNNCRGSSMAIIINPGSYNVVKVPFGSVSVWCR